MFVTQGGLVVKLRSVLFVAIAGLSLLVLPASAVALVCFDLTDTSTTTPVGKFTVASDFVPTEGFFFFMGQFVHDAAFCPQGGGEGAPGVGQFALIGNAANASFATSGTPNCFPVTINIKVPNTADPNLAGTFTLDLEALAAAVTGTLKTGTCPATLP
jgi:hypothetical protein